MKRQVSMLAEALANENQRIATEGGVGDIYNKAMREYRNAKHLEGISGIAKDIAKSTAMKYVLGSTGLGAGYYAAKKLLGD
jgi:hypothetical protein